MFYDEYALDSVAAQGVDASEELGRVGNVVQTMEDSQEDPEVLRRTEALHKDYDGVVLMQ